jgi:hypothetical protein
VGSHLQTCSIASICRICNLHRLKFIAIYNFKIASNYVTWEYGIIEYHINRLTFEMQAKLFYPPVSGFKPNRKIKKKWLWVIQ